MKIKRSFRVWLSLAAVVIAAAGCSQVQSGPLIVSEASSPALTLKDGRWEAEAMLVDQSAEGLPAGLPPPPKAKSTWLRPRGTIINRGTQTLTDIQLILHAREKRSQRVHEKVISFNIELKPGEEYKIEFQHPLFLVLGSPRIDRCEATLQAEVKSATPGN